MINKSKKVLAISGSTRMNSNNEAILKGISIVFEEIIFINLLITIFNPK